MFRTKVVGNIKTHILWSILFFPDNRAVYETTWKSIVNQGRPQMTIWLMRIACWILQATNLLTYLLTYSLTCLLYGSESFLRRKPIFS